MVFPSKDLEGSGFGAGADVYVVAEIGINHGGKLKLAEQLIDSAVRAGVNAVKFQTYLTDKRAPKGSPIYDILKQCKLPFAAFKKLKKYAEQYKIDFFSTPFDEESVKYLESIGCKLYKIASFDVPNTHLLRIIAQTKKPVIISTGMSNIAEIKHAYRILSEETESIAILHCISAYPTKEEDANLSAIYALKRLFNCIIGQSDHSKDIQVPLYAVAAGARIIEKHYMIDDEMNCVDAPVSITEKQMKRLIDEIRRLEKVLGNGKLGLTEAEKGCKRYRRFS